jgi:hypothetical protein
MFELFSKDKILSRVLSKGLLPGNFLNPEVTISFALSNFWRAIALT